MRLPFGHGGKAVRAECAVLSQLVRTDLDIPREMRMPKPFQAEYEGSIPFTRSNVFNDLAREAALFLMISF
jgi:hypothetical protein